MYFVVTPILKILYTARMQGTDSQNTAMRAMQDVYIREGFDPTGTVARLVKAILADYHFLDNVAKSEDFLDWSGLPAIRKEIEEALKPFEVIEIQPNSSI